MRAVLFDLDGTLMDSEILTDRSVEEIMARHGVPGVRLPPDQMRGRTWTDIAHALCERHPGRVAPGPLEAELEARWMELDDHAAPLPGAAEAVREAADHLAVAIVSSSPRQVIDRFLDRLGVSACVPAHARIGAGDAAHPKPAPDGFLLGAERLGVPPADAVVFEDSSAGLRAARAAGMSTIAILYACAEPERCRALADRAIQDYLALPAGFWAALAARGVAAID